MPSISPETYQNQADQEFAMLSVIPKNYNLSDEKNISTFATRLKKARQTYAKRQNVNENADEKEITQEFLAKYVGVSIMTISKYEAGKIKKIPVKKFRRICELLDVTPHYLLGLVPKAYQCLEIDKGGNEITEDGEPHILQRPMAFDPPLCMKAVDIYRTLFEEDAELYWLINDLICSPLPKRNYYKRILASILNG